MYVQVLQNVTIEGYGKYLVESTHKIRFAVHPFD